MSKCAITFRSSFDSPLIVESDFAQITAEMGMNAAQGRLFVVLEQEDGDPALVNMREILLITPVDD